MEALPSTAALPGHVSRHQTPSALLSQRYYRCFHLSNSGQYSPYVLRQVCPIPPLSIPRVGRTDQYSILPAIAFTLDMYRRTGQFFGINEALFSSAMGALIFSVFGAQPLNIVGITGLISLFNYTIFNIVTRYEPVIYANFMCWTAIWAAIFHWIVAVCNLCDYMRYVTDFSSESFGMYIGIVYLCEHPKPYPIQE